MFCRYVCVCVCVFTCFDASSTAVSGWRVFSRRGCRHAHLWCGKRSEESARVYREATLSRCGCFYVIFHARLEHTEQVIGGEGGCQAHGGGLQETPRCSVAFFAAFLEGLVDLDFFFFVRIPHLAFMKFPVCHQWSCRESPPPPPSRLRL